MEQAVPQRGKLPACVCTSNELQVGLFCCGAIGWLKRLRAKILQVSTLEVYAVLAFIRKQNWWSCQPGRPMLLL